MSAVEISQSVVFIPKSSVPSNRKKISPTSAPPHTSRLPSHPVVRKPGVLRLQLGAHACTVLAAMLPPADDTAPMIRCVTGEEDNKGSTFPGVSSANPVATEFARRSASIGKSIVSTRPACVVRSDFGKNEVAKRVVSTRWGTR